MIGFLGNFWNFAIINNRFSTVLLSILIPHVTVPIKSPELSRIPWLNWGT